MIIKLESNASITSCLNKLVHFLLSSLFVRLINCAEQSGERSEGLWVNQEG